MRYTLGYLCVIIICHLCACSDQLNDQHDEVLHSSTGQVDEDQAQFTWKLRSFKVDATLTVSTQSFNTSECSSQATLYVNTITESAERYRLSTDCQTIALSDDGDLILFNQPSDYDWRMLKLKVNTSSERLSLGPVDLPTHLPTERVQLILEAPPCVDHSDCDCGKLHRKSRSLREEEPTIQTLDLGKKCD